MIGEKEFDLATDEFLAIASKFGQDKGYDNRQMIALLVWVVAMSVEASVQLDGDKHSETYKTGLRRLIDEIDRIVDDSRN